MQTRPLESGEAVSLSTSDKPLRLVLRGPGIGRGFYLFYRCHVVNRFGESGRDFYAKACIEQHATIVRLVP